VGAFVLINKCQDYKFFSVKIRADNNRDQRGLLLGLYNFHGNFLTTSNSNLWQIRNEVAQAPKFIIM
jgi:hypothetical protein